MSRQHNRTRYLPQVFAAIAFASASAIGTAGLAAAEIRDVDTPEYRACIEDLLGKEFRYESAIGVCCAEAGAETLRDDHGDPYNCVTNVEVEDSTQPPQSKPGAVPPQVSNPGLAPPPTPTTTPPVIAPAPAPGLAPR